MLIAVYGSLRKGFGNNNIIESAIYKGEFDTKPEYSLYAVSPSFPGLKENGTTSIRMEVYEVDEHTLSRVNMLEGYNENRNSRTNHYNRITITTPFGKAYAYIYNSGVGTHELIESGDWKEYKENNKKFENV